VVGPVIAFSPDSTETHICRCPVWPVMRSRTQVMIGLAAAVAVVILLALAMHAWGRARPARLSVSCVLEEPECAARLVEHMGISNVRVAPRTNHSLGKAPEVAAGSDANGKRNQSSR